MTEHVSSTTLQLSDAPTCSPGYEMKKLNVINRESDRMLGRRPIEFIEAANPTVIIDEPQSVDTTEKSRRAIGNLNPVAVHVQNYRRLNQRRFWMHFGSGD